MRTAILLSVALVLAGCLADDETSSHPAPPPAESAPADTASPSVARTPAQGYLELDLDRVERERLDETWRASADADRERRAAEPGRAPGAAERAGAREAAAEADPLALLRRRLAGEAGTPAPTDPDAGPASEARNPTPPAAESFADISPEALAGDLRAPAPGGAGPSVLRLQWMLDRVGFSPGVLDGRWGKNTEKAVYWLQNELGLEPTGRVDERLNAALSEAVGVAEPVRRVTLAADDLAGPFVEIPPEDYEAMAELECLCYESAQELVAERYHTTPELLVQLNPEVDLEVLQAGTTLWVPDVEVVEPKGPAGPGRVDRIVISKGGLYLQALDADGHVLQHSPTVIGAQYSPSPDGSFSAVGVAYDPDFHYQPKLFPEVPDTEADALLPPGPNSPVGRVWIQLSEDNYGIHGTAEPQTISYTTSHGCVRLTNWDALRLANRLHGRLGGGVPVDFTE